MATRKFNLSAPPANADDFGDWLVAYLESLNPVDLERVNDIIWKYIQPELEKLGGGQ